MRPGSMTAVSIRAVRETDEARWRLLWDGYNRFYGASVPDHVTDKTWRRLLDPASSMFCLVAEIDRTVVGLANCILHPGTWTSEPSCYLEDLFVDIERRRLGVATLLIDRLLLESLAAGWSRLYWHTLETNPARALYDRYTAADAYHR